MIQSEETERNKKKKEFQELTNRLVRSRAETSQKRKRKRILKIVITFVIHGGRDLFLVPIEAYSG